MTFGRKGLDGQAAAGNGSPGFGMRGGGSLPPTSPGIANALKRGESGDAAMSPELRAFLAAERQREAQTPQGEISDIAVATPRPAPRRIGQPGGAKKSMMLAYVLWHFGSALAAHRFYLGATQSAILLAALFWGGLAIMLVWPPLGLVSIGSWLLWLFADLFLIPGLTRAANADDQDTALVFA